MSLGLHPHIVSCYYVRRLGGIPRVFAEFVEGGSLHDWISRGKLYEGGTEKALERILDIAIQFAWGLHYAHDQGLVHHDVKPANVMMTPDGTAKVTDFGLAKARAAAGEATIPDSGRSILVSTGGMTPAYCSPEQAAGQKLARRTGIWSRAVSVLVGEKWSRVTPPSKTDIWSWAVSVLEMFWGEVAWPSGTIAPMFLETLLQNGTEKKAIPKMPKSIAELLRLCFQEDPAKRPTDMIEVSATLRSVYEQSVGTAHAREEPKPAEAPADSLNNQALSMLDLKKPQEAENLWKQALKADPQHPQSIYNRGLLLWRSGRLADDALVRELEESQRQKGEDWNAGWLLGQVHLERRDEESAVRELAEVVPRCGEDAQVAHALAQAKAVQGRGLRCRWTGQEHTGFVASVAISLDCRWGLSGSEDQTLRLWDLSSGQCLRIFQGHDGRVLSVAISPDGRCGLSGSVDNRLCLWDLVSGKCLSTFYGHSKEVRTVAISPDGRWGMSGSYDNTLRLWDLSSGQCLRTFQEHTGSVNSIAISSDGRSCLSGSNDNTLRLWELSSGRCLRIFKGHTNGVLSVAISPDSRWALSGGGGLVGSQDNTLRLWDLASGQCLQTLVEHISHVSSVAISPNGRWGLSGSDTIRLWDLSSGQCLRTFKGHKRDASSVAISADGRWGLSGSYDRSLCLWELGTGVPGRLAVTRPWSTDQAGENQAVFQAKLAGAQRAAAAGQIAEALALTGQARAIPGRGQSATARDVLAQLGKWARKLSLSSAQCVRTVPGHSNRVSSVAISPDSRWGLSGSWDSILLNKDNILLCDLSSGQRLRAFQGHTSSVHSVVISPDGRWALSGSSDATLRLWELSSGRCLRIFQGHSKAVLSVAISSDSRWGLSGSYDNTLRLWELSSGRCLRIFQGHSKAVRSVAISPDSRWGLSGSDNTLRLWELSSGQCLQIFQGHSNEVGSVAISADGRWGLSGGYDSTLRLWELTSGRCLRSFQGHTNGVLSVAISPDSRWALSGGGDKTIRLWEVSSGQCLQIFQGDTGTVHSVTFSSDGRWGLSGSGGATGNPDNILRLWEFVWDYEFPGWADWDEGARSHLANFLTLHTQPVGQLPKDGTPTETEVLAALTRCGKPSWTEEDFRGLLYTLGCAGYGWLRPEGVRRELEKMAANWKGPPPLPGMSRDIRPIRGQRKE
ncbi:MAG: serine/threonine protein kinase [Verrucomicrobiae bacterium]|nr:serine/threonine protein kinase [Verrucomicrobiae bacterium]